MFVGNYTIQTKLSLHAFLGPEDIGTYQYLVVTVGS
jgi:hypothetical protein